MSDRSLIVDLSYITGVDNEGRAMLHGWYAGGAQLIATRPAARKIVESITRQDTADESQNRAQPVGENRFHLSTPSLAAARLKERNLTLPG
jgi:hypothetical protein